MNENWNAWHQAFALLDRQCILCVKLIRKDLCVISEILNVQLGVS
jgi:hypothetical protein